MNASMNDVENNKYESDELQQQMKDFKNKLFHANEESLLHV